MYKKTNIFVYTPFWPEGLPTSILEAGYMNCACIATPQGGIKEIIKDKENGLLINNEKELTDALELLINNKDLQTKYGKKLQETVLKNFYWENVAKKIEHDILEKLN